jgi:hypothetical protein
MGSVVNVEGLPLYPLETDRVRIVEEAGWVPGSVTIYILYGKWNIFSAVTGLKRQSQLLYICYNSEAGRGERKKKQNMFRLWLVRVTSVGCVGYGTTLC